MSGPGDSLRARLERAEVTLTARDGDRYVLRTIRPTDAPSLIRGYETLSPRAKWFRMLHAVPHLTEEMAARFCAPDPETECCVVVEGHDSLTGEILGGARVADIGPGRDAEFSVSMRPEAQGLGLARQALETVIAVAREAGCRSVWGLISPANHAMLGLAERIGFAIRRDPDDVTLIRADLPL